MRQVYRLALILLLISACASTQGQELEPVGRLTMYDVPPRWLVDVPTAGTLPRAHYNIGVRIFPNGGGLGYTDIGLSSRFTLGISYGGENIVSNTDPNWNNRIGFSLKFRLIDELEYFPAITVGFSDQGFGAWLDDHDRYTFKSRGFYGVASRSFYFYKWTAGWHIGINRSLEDNVDGDNDLNVFGGFDATFNYNLALVFEYDAALNDDRNMPAAVTGKGRGYLNTSVKWLFAENLELELVFKDLLINRRESDMFSREVRMTYIDHF
ncbi:MAG TPA: hypothetical protein VMY05_08700 [Acidobacteriota bacterium]|nr:hypothetical protein [Acidobacteriota bacterium]